MWAGISIDSVQQVLAPDGRFNDDVANAENLIATQFIALVVAFTFTLAFRGIVPIVVVYFGAAATVLLLIAGGLVLQFRALAAPALVESR